MCHLIQHHIEELVDGNVAVIARGYLRRKFSVLTRDGLVWFAEIDCWTGGGVFTAPLGSVSEAATGKALTAPNRKPPSL